MMYVYTIAHCTFVTPSRREKHSHTHTHSMFGILRLLLRYIPAHRTEKKIAYLPIWYLVRIRRLKDIIQYRIHIAIQPKDDTPVPCVLVRCKCKYLNSICDCGRTYSRIYRCTSARRCVSVCVCGEVYLL